MQFRKTNVHLALTGDVGCAALIWMGTATPSVAQLRGHVGPVRALAISDDGTTAISGSFDTSAIRWSLTNDAAEQVLRFHEGSVNAVALLPDGRAVTAGEDARIAIWALGKQQPDVILEGHQGPIVALAVSPDGASLASASWDHSVRLWPLRGGPQRVLEGHRRNVNAVAFATTSKVLVTADYGATLRIWPLDDLDSPEVRTLPSPLNALVVARDGEIVSAGSDGKVYFLSPEGESRAVVDASDAPILSLAISGDGARIAAASIGGSVAILDRKTRTVLRTLAGTGLPVWSAAFLPDGSTLLTGGADRVIRRWNAETGEPIGSSAIGTPEDPLAPYAGDSGAQVFRACVACHTLSPDEGNRAGPTLHGIFGRRIATVPGYHFSAALKQLDIICTPETLAKLLEVGPAAYTPGTKMPQQRMGAEDRVALVKFLERATR